MCLMIKLHWCDSCTNNHISMIKWYLSLRRWFSREPWPFLWRWLGNVGGSRGIAKVIRYIKSCLGNVNGRDSHGCFNGRNVVASVWVTRMWLQVYEWPEYGPKCMSDQNVVPKVWVTRMWSQLNEWQEYGLYCVSAQNIVVSMWVTRIRSQVYE